VPRLFAPAEVDLGIAEEATDAREAFASVVMKYREPVYRVAVHMMRNHEDADDVVQETFLRAYRALDRFRGDASMGTYLYRTVTNVCLNRLRARDRARRFLGLLSWHGQKSSPPPSRELLASEATEVVRAAVGSLPPKLRAALVLSEFEGLTAPQIAEVLQIPDGTVRSRLHLARAKLREKLADYVRG